MLLIYCQYLFNINGNVVEKYHWKEIRFWLPSSYWMLSFLFSWMTRNNREQLYFCFFLRCCEASWIIFCTFHLHTAKCARHRKYGWLPPLVLYLLPPGYSRSIDVVEAQQSVCIPPLLLAVICEQRNFGKTLKNIVLLLTWRARNFKYRHIFRKNQTIFSKIDLKGKNIEIKKKTVK